MNSVPASVNVWTPSGWKFHHGYDEYRVLDTGALQVTVGMSTFLYAPGGWLHIEVVPEQRDER